MDRIAVTCAAALLVLVVACGGGDTTRATSSFVPVTAASGCSGGDYRSRAALYSAAQAGEVPSGTPRRLGRAVAAVPPALFSSVLYVGCSAEEVDDLGFEQMVWSNGIGLLLISWQEWPDDGDMGVLPFGGTSRQAGVVQVAAMDETAVERSRVVHLFDGFRVLTVATFSLTTLSIEQAEEIGWAVYDALPVDMNETSGRGVSRTTDQFTSSLESDQITVGDPGGVDEMSPFTATLGIAHTTTRFTVAGSEIRVYDFGAIGAARRAAASVSTDGYTIAHFPFEAVASPHFWSWDRLIILYMGDDTTLIERMNEVVGPPFAGV